MFPFFNERSTGWSRSSSLVRHSTLQDFFELRGGVLRHFFVPEVFRNGVAAPMVQRLARHSDLVTKQRYAAVDANDLRAAIARLDGPRAEALGQGTKD